MFFITVKAALFLTKIDKSAVFYCLYPKNIWFAMESPSNSPNIWRLHANQRRLHCDTTAKIKKYAIRSGVAIKFEKVRELL